MAAEWREVHRATCVKLLACLMICPTSSPRWICRGLAPSMAALPKSY